MFFKLSGESVLSMIVGVGNLDGIDYLLIFVSFAIVYIIKDIYFNNDCEQSGHALSEPAFPGNKNKNKMQDKFSTRRKKFLCPSNEKKTKNCSKKGQLFFLKGFTVVF